MRFLTTLTYDSSLILNVRAYIAYLLKNLLNISYLERYCLESGYYKPTLSITPLISVFTKNFSFSSFVNLNVPTGKASDCSL